MPYAYGTVSYAKYQECPVTCRIRHSPKTHSFPLIPVYEIESKNQKNASNNVRIHPQTIAYDSLTNSIHHILIYQLLGIKVQTQVMNTDEYFQKLESINQTIF